ncbi:MAG: hypothetical protein NVS4B9_41220 [Ktedonobacteraceae bacterium]
MSTMNIDDIQIRFATPVAELLIKGQSANRTAALLLHPRSRSLACLLNDTTNRAKPE